MADEDDIGLFVAALEKQVQQDEETFGQVLFALAHRAGDIHQAKHHRLRVRARELVETLVTDVDRIEVGDIAP